MMPLAMVAMSLFPALLMQMSTLKALTANILDAQSNIQVRRDKCEREFTEHISSIYIYCKTFEAV
jgi:hypothetical protein